MLLDVPAASTEHASAEEIAGIKWADFWFLHYADPLGSDDGGLHFSYRPVQVGALDANRRFAKNRLTGELTRLPPHAFLCAREMSLDAWLPDSLRVRGLLRGRLPSMLDEPLSVFSAVRHATPVTRAPGRLSFEVETVDEVEGTIVTLPRLATDWWTFIRGEVVLRYAVAEYAESYERERTSLAAGLSRSGFVAQQLLVQLVAACPTDGSPS
ncbi:hypothetical protein F6X40_10270 [Paraburkholderia sp. UCT31]|uniref:hypothetical protein n=1 Tax=Paraburkholderia sp. UCT31 TaxID=2615209 RepID=UPI001655891B|nr:hypothetical protein [Paraburkholderia sp. UCT31]MBC8737193.1 hypothetical protein [Paraburkholderia sp. UCT31]